jgi:hypothetical protein
MALTREQVEVRYAEIRKATERNDWEAFAECFAEDGTFVNSFLAEPHRGREAIKLAAKSWPNVVNHPEWVVIEGSRLVTGWNERQESMPSDRAPYRGFSTFVFDDEGHVASYEGMFDTAALLKAMAS